VFLPRIFLLTLFLALVASCGQATGPKRPQLDVAHVVAGTGDVSPDVVERIRKIVATELVPLQKVFDGKEIERFFVHVHGSRAEMPEQLVAGVHKDSPGFAILGRHQIHLIWGEMIRLGSKPAGVVRHELVHELLDQYVKPNGRHIPRWFHEGLAQVLAGDTYLGAREDDLVWRASVGSLPSMASLRERFPKAMSDVRTAYAQSFSYVAWLSREYGMSTLLRCARYADRMTSFGGALVGQTGRDSLQLETAWKHYIIYGSGAPWRVMFSSWFSLLMILVLPVLVVALIRRLNAEERAARRIAARTKADALAAERAAQVRAETEEESAAWLRESEARPGPEGEEGDDPDRLREDGGQGSG
jgi:hypothetical protein